MSSTSALLSRIGTSVHESSRAKHRRHDRRRGRPVGGGGGGGGGIPSAPPQPRDPPRGARGAAALLASICLLGGGRAVLLRLGVVVGPVGAASAPPASGAAGASVGRYGQPRRKKVNRLGGAPVLEDVYGGGRNVTVVFESDPSKPVAFLGRGVELPEVLGRLANVLDPALPGSDVAVFWHLPRSGGATFKAVASECLGLTVASDRGSLLGAPEGALGVVTDHLGGRYVNVDANSPGGLERAQRLGLASFRPLDLIFSSYLMEAAALFEGTPSRGRVVALLRHPIERASSLYYQMATDPEGRAELAMNGIDSLELYASSGLAENNWMTRFLSGKMSGDLTTEDEAVAREVLRTKVLVGRLDRKEESLWRFARYLGWDLEGGPVGVGVGVGAGAGGHPYRPAGEGCADRIVGWGWEGKISHPTVVEGSDVWMELWRHNTFDVRVYDWAAGELWNYQGLQFA